MIPFVHLGPLTVGTFGLLLWLACVCAWLVLSADLRRRGLRADALNIVAVTAVAGVVGAKIWHVLDTPGEWSGGVVEALFSRSGFAWFGGLVAGLLALLYLGRRYGMPPLEMLDVCSPAAAVGYGVGRLGCLVSGDGDYGSPTHLPWGIAFPPMAPTSWGPGHIVGWNRGAQVPSLWHGVLVRVHSTPVYEFVIALLIAWYLWRQGAKATRGPRPWGKLAGEYLVLTGVARFFMEFIRWHSPDNNPVVALGLSNAQWASVGEVAAGAALIALARRRFRRTRGEHRILEHHARRGDVMQPEYHRPTPECPHPERWRMYDSMTAEVEVLEFLKSLVVTLKPELVVETGTFMGISTLWIAEALKENGFGRVVTCEYDPKVYAEARRRIDASGLDPWIDCRNESSLEMTVEGTIDLLFCDSEPTLREQEIRRFLPQMRPTGVILVHDASSHLRVVRQAALKLETEGLISTVLLPTPRGLVMAQRRAGRA